VVGRADRYDGMQYAHMPEQAPGVAGKEDAAKDEEFLAPSLDLLPGQSPPAAVGRRMDTTGWE